MTLTLVKFACYKNDEPTYHLLDDKKFDDWLIGEPPEGYHLFHIVGHYEIESLLIRDGVETLDLLDFLPGRVDKS